MGEDLLRRLNMDQVDLCWITTGEWRFCGSLLRLPPTYVY